MGKNLLNQKYLHDENAAHDHLIKMRWPDGIVCPHCQAKKVYQLNVSASKRRVLKCGKCRKQFSSTLGTIFEDSHVPLTKWFMTLPSYVLFKEEYERPSTASHVRRHL